MATDPLPPPPGHPALAQALTDLVRTAGHAAGARPPYRPEPQPHRSQPHRSTADPSEQDRAQRLADAAVEALAADAATVLLVDDRGGPVVATGSDDGSRALCHVEVDAGDGPALACARAGDVLVLEVAALAGTWHLWTDAALREGWGLAEAVPMQAAGRSIGGMVLLTRAGRPRPDPGLVWARALATIAATAMAHHRAALELERRAEQLQTALTSRVVIEQAKGVLAERGGIDVQAAFDRLRRYARAHRCRLVDAAAEVVNGEVADDVLTHVPPLPGPPSILEG